MEMALAVETAPTQEEEMQMAMQMFGSMGAIMLASIPLMLGLWGVWAMIEAELHRRVLRDDAHSGFFPWRFGKDELRVMLCQFVVWLAGMGLFFAIYFVLIIGIVAAAAGGSQSVILGIIGGLIAFAVVIGGIILFAYVIIRLAPASALTIARREISIGEAWGITKGRFWPAFGAYALQWIGGYLVIYVISMVIMMALLGTAFASMATGFGGNDEENLRQMLEMFTAPGFLVSIIIATFLTTIISAFWYLCIAGIGAHLVALKRADDEESSAAVFS